ncbi:unnamed protein product [Adineta ricciae]|uniref:Uncharacterized protein n=1 Tax=Adineta ricciae TaxID=249248 RepID=A0A815TDH7_ADIRI|nr:unnamed protein product [Adineta ricciae]
METFKYGRFDCANRPPPVLAKHFQNNHIVATAAQKLCFFKLFPVIFYDIIDNLPSFIVYKLLREILYLVLANPFRKAWLPVLGELCDTFYREMLNHFPDLITPKVHFIREYHQMVTDFGPAVRQWCFRYEGFHAYFKKITHRTNNFKNIPKMLVTRYRLKQCLKLGYLPELRHLQHVIGIKKIRSTCFNLAMRNFLVKHFDQIDFDNVFQCNALVYEYIEYRRSCVYVVDLQPSHEQPSFAQIIFILKMKEKWWLFVDMLDIMSYNEKLSSWQIQSMDHYSIIDPKHDVDGAMLKMLNSVERISSIIPKLKQQLIFLEEREKLFQQINDNSNASSISKTSQSISTSSQITPIASTNPITSASTFMTTTINLSLTSDDNSISHRSFRDPDALSPLSDDYQVPPLPNVLTKDIEAGILTNFRPHCQGRQILVDAVVHDLIENYNLLYPSKAQYHTIGTALVKCLELAVTTENLGIWKDALQTKLKRTRTQHSSSDLVQEVRLKYSKLGSGRPVKQKIGEVAERDKHKQLVLIPYDEISNDMDTKVEQLKNLSQFDHSTQLRLWRETFALRRQSVRAGSTNDILKQFPAYSNDFFIFEEVRMLVNIDLSSEVRRQIPILVDKLLETPVFVTDSPPIRLIKALCKLFGETTQHLFCDKEPPTPYPTLVCIDDLIYVYVDFLPIVSTNSPDDAVALLISMYTIFELSFDKKSRTIRLLYCVLHGDKQFLSNSVRVLIKEKNINIQREPPQLPSMSCNSLRNNPITTDTTPVTRTQMEINVSDGSTAEHTSVASLAKEQATLAKDRRSSTVVESDANNNDENTSSFSRNPIQRQAKEKRKRKQSVIEDEEIDTRDDHELLSVDRLPMNDITNSSVSLRHSKRKRRA